MEWKIIENVQNGSDYRFYNQEKWFIESRDAIFLESTNQITPLVRDKITRIPWKWKSGSVYGCF